MDDEEGDLLRAWRDGDSRAGSVLFDRHFEAVWRFFSNKVTDGIEDLVQQTFLACTARRDHIRPDLGFRPYLFAVAKSKLYDHLRERAKMAAIDGGLVSVADLGMSPSGVLSERDEEALVVVALRRLPLDLQMVMELYYFESMRGAALAQALEIPEGTVRSRLRRGLQLLREAIEVLAMSPEALQQTQSTLASWAAALHEGADPSSS